MSILHSLLLVVVLASLASPRPSPSPPSSSPSLSIVNDNRRADPDDYPDEPAPIYKPGTMTTKTLVKEAWLSQYKLLLEISIEITLGPYKVTRFKFRE